MDTVGSRPQPADQVMSWRSTLALPKELLLTPCQVIYGFLGSEYYASLCNTPTDFSAHGESQSHKTFRDSDRNSLINLLRPGTSIANRSHKRGIMTDSISWVQ